MNPMGYLFAKGLHIIAFTSWFAGLFYLVRLFVYDVESSRAEEPRRSVLRAQFELMEGRLWRIIIVPAMVVTLAAGSYLAVSYAEAAGGFAALGWLHLKLTLVLALLGYHHVCGRIRKQLSQGVCRWTEARLRLWNEVATVLLATIVMVAVFKTLFSVVWGGLAVLAFGVVLFVAATLYRRARAR